MKNTAKDSLKKGEMALVTTAQQHLEIAPQQKANIEFYEIIGAAKVINRLTTSLTSQLLLTLKRFQENESYKAYGCDTWVQFLKEHPELDLSKSQYYDRIKLLESEGAEVFDLLTQMNVPLSARKQLTSGSIMLEGNELLIGEQRVPVDDAKKVKRAISQIAEQMERLEMKAEKATKENEKLKGKLDDARAAAREAASTVPFNDNTDPANQAYMRVVASLTELNRELSEMDADDAESRLASYRPGISQAVENCFTFSAATSPTRRPTNQAKSELGLSDSDLADLMEE